MDDVALPSGLWLGRTIEELVAEELGRKRQERLRRTARIAGASIVVVVFVASVWALALAMAVPAQDPVVVVQPPPEPSRTTISDAEKSLIFRDFQNCVTIASMKGKGACTK